MLASSVTPGDSHLPGARGAAAPNSRSDLEQRAQAGQLIWLGPVIMLIARTLLAYAAQGLVAAIYLLPLLRQA